MKPCLLIASPQMHDAFFEKALVLLWHHDENGAIGVVVNKPLDRPLPEVLELPEPMELSAYDRTLVSWGGPVETHHGTVVAIAEVDDEEGWNLPGGLAVTRSQDALVRLLRDRAELMLYLGYAGWGPEQLDTEIERGSWLVTDVDPDLVLRLPAEARYDTALATLGLTQQTVWMTPIDE